MKKISLILSFIICSFISFGQNGTWNQVNLSGNPNSISDAPGAVRGRLGVITGNFTDTIAANVNLKTNSVPGTQVWITSTKSYWFWNGFKWVEISPVSAQCQSSLIGSATWSGTGLIYNVSALQYNFPPNYCIFYNTAATQVTIPAADATLNRIDAIIVDNGQVVSVLSGALAQFPIAPVPNPFTQRVVGYVRVNAGSTVPSGTSSTIVYNENIEWVGSGTAPVNFTSGTLPCVGSVSALVTNPVNGQYVQWQNGSSLDVGSNTFFNFQVSLNNAVTAPSVSFFTVTFYDGATQTTVPFQVANGSYGFNSSLLNTCQKISIPLIPPFNIPTFDRVKIVFDGLSASNFKLDYANLIFGTIVPPPITNSWGIDTRNDVTGIINPGIGTFNNHTLDIYTGNSLLGKFPVGWSINSDTSLRNVKWNPIDSTFYIDYTPTIRADSPLYVYQNTFKDHIAADTNYLHPNALVNYAYFNAHSGGSTPGLLAVTHVGDSTDLRIKSEGIKLWGQGETDSALIQLNQRGTDNTFRALVAKPRRDSFPQFSIGYAFYPSASASPPYADSSNYVWNLFTNSDAAGNRINATKSSQGFSFETNFEDRGEGHWVFSPVTGAQQRIFSFKSKLDGTAIESYFTTDAQWMYDHNLNIYTRNDAGALALYANHPSLSFGGANANATPIPSSTALDFLNYNGKIVLAKSTGGYGTSALYIGTTGDSLRTPARNLYLAYGQGAGRTNLSFEGSLFIPAHYSGALTYTTVNTDGTPSDATAQSFSFLKRLNNTAGINTPLGVSGVDMFINGSETYMPITDNWATFDNVGNSLRFPFNSTANKPTTNLGYNVFINTDSSNRMAVRQPGGGTYKTLAYTAQDSTATPQNIIWQDNNGTQHKGAYPSGGGSSPAGNYNAVQLNRNGQFDAMGSDSLIADGGLKVKGTMSADIVTSIIQVITPQITSGGVALNIEAANQVTTIGDPFGAGGGTKVEIDDNALTIASVATNGWTHTGNFNVNTATYTNGFLKVNNDGTFFIGDGAASDNNTYYKGDDVAGTLNLRGDNGISMRGAVTMSTYTTGIATFGVGGGITSNPLSGLTSGTYTPTLSNTTNVTSSTPIICHYTRVGNEVTVTGSVGVITTAALATVLGISLPVVSNLAAITDASGVGQASSAIAANAFVQGNTTTDVAELRFTGLAISGTGNIYFTFTYSIL